jgi:hypothetical protein
MAEPRVNPKQAESLGQGQQKSRQKAETAFKTAVESNEVASPGWPHNADGKPLVKITMTAAELIPTGDFANVSIGPAQITAFIDPDAVETFDQDQKDTMARAINELAEIVESDVIAVQRNLVLESLQDQISK